MSNEISDRDPQSHRDPAGGGSANLPAADSPAETRAAMTENKVRRAFSSYRLMAFITGAMLLILCSEMIMKYVFGLNGYENPDHWQTARPVLGTWVAIVHGWIYVIYALTVFHLWSTMRWGFGRIVMLILGGVVPFLSFVMEARAKSWVEDSLPELVARAAARDALDRS